MKDGIELFLAKTKLEYKHILAVERVVVESFAKCAPMASNYLNDKCIQEKK